MKKEDSAEGGGTTFGSGIRLASFFVYIVFFSAWSACSVLIFFRRTEVSLVWSGGSGPQPRRNLMARS